MRSPAPLPPPFPPHPPAGLGRSVSGAAAVTRAVGAGLSGGRDGRAGGGRWRSTWPPSSEQRRTKSTVHFISKSELVVMETDVLGCTTNQHLARQLDFKKNGTNVRFQVCLG